MTNTELKAYIKSKLSFEDEKVLEEVTKRMKKEFENSLFGMTKIEILIKDNGKEDLVQSTFGCHLGKL